jgi:hypothetical protein
MGWFNRDKVNSITPYANSGQHKPRVGAKPDTHTVRDDSGNTTQAMTQRRADRDATSASGPHSGYVNPSGGDAMGPKKPNIKIGAEYTTYHEPSSPEGKAILKDKKKSAKALKKVNSPKVMAESKAAGQSFDVAKEQETKRMKTNESVARSQTGPFAIQPERSEKAYLEGGAKGEQAYRQKENKMRADMDKDMPY